MHSRDGRAGSHGKRRRYDDDDSYDRERRTRRRTSPSSEDSGRQDRDRFPRRHRESRRRPSGAEEDYRERGRIHQTRSRNRDDSWSRKPSSPNPEEDDSRRVSGKSDYEARRQRSPDDSDGDLRYRRGKERDSHSPKEMRRDAYRRRDRSRDHDHDREKRQRRRSRSPYRERRERSPRGKHRVPSRSASPIPRSHKPLPSQNESFNALTRTGLTPPPNDKPIPKEKPNYSNTGLLARETNLVVGTDIVLKYNEPAEARKPPPSQAWRMFIFKGRDVLDTIELGGKSVWLLGRESKVVDIIAAHPSCSGQHAVVQFRHTTKTGKNGEPRPGVRPYLLDLESGNGTVLNGQKVESRRYVELRSGDLVKFGNSEREYVIMLPPKES